jgi:ABC-type nitrate/sulfonate/bicarbonate transport system ATPase subunit
VTLAPPRIELDRVRRAFGPLLAVEEVSLSLARGECLALLGPSGSGKSTVLAMAAGLLAPDSGRVLLDGAPLEGPGRVGLMPQRDLLLPWRRLVDNLVLAADLQGRPREPAVRAARELLPLFDLAGFEAAWPGELSGGMRQRAALLRTVLAGHDTLLLDEPFGALDALTRLGLQDWLAGMRRRFGWTVLLVTHSPDEAVFLADRVLVLSPRPARLVAEIAVPLPQPRAAGSRAGPEFGRVLGRVLEAIGMR